MSLFRSTLAGLIGVATGMSVYAREIIQVEAEDGKDITVALQKAFNDARALKKPAEVRLAKGRYYISSDLGSGLAITVAHIRNMIFDGGESELIVTNPRVGLFRIAAVRDSVLQNFTVDWDPLPFTQGRIIKVDAKANTIDLKIDQGFPSPEDPQFKKLNSFWGSLKDRNVPGRLKLNSNCFYPISEVSKLNSDTYKLKLSRVSGAAAGDVFTVLGRHDSSSFIMIQGSEKVTFRNITNHSAPGANYLALRNDGLVFDNCRVMLKPGRWQTSNSDGIHCQSHKKGPDIQNCLFEGIPDDCINIYAHPSPVIDYRQPNILHVAFTFKTAPGDVITIYNPKTGEERYSSTVKSVKTLPKEGGRTRDELIMNDPLPGNLEKNERLSGKMTDQVYNMSYTGAGFIIKNNIFRNSRRHGILLRSHDGVVEDNLFQGLSGSALSMTNGLSWSEGLNCKNIVIRGNTVDNCVFAHHGATAAIAIRMIMEGYKPSVWKGHSNIIIENNKIIANAEYGILIESARDLKINANSITLTGRFKRAASAINIKNAENIDLTDNKTHGNFPALKTESSSCTNINSLNNTRRSR